MRRARGRSAAPSAGPIPTSPHRNLSSGLILCFVFLPSHVPHPVRHAPPVGTTLGGWVNPERRKGQNPSGVITLRLLRDRYRAPDPASGTSTRPRRRCGGSLLGVWHMVAGSQKASTGPRHRCRGSGSPGTLVISETYNSSCEQLLGTRQPGIRGRFEPDGHPARTFMLSRTWAIASAHRGLRGARPLAATNVAPESRPRRRTAQAPCMHAREKRWSCLPFLPPARRPRRALGPGRGG